MIRKFTAAASLLTLAACGGGGNGIETLSGVGLGSGLDGSNSSTPPSLVAPTQAVTFSTYSATQSLTLNDEILVPTVVPGDPNPPLNGTSIGGSSLYVANQPLGLSPDVQVRYDPRDATFDLTINTAGLSHDGRYQDPAHRTNFPADWVPRISGAEYYESGSGRVETGNLDQTNYIRNTFFFETPGRRTRYVTYAGFYRRTYNAANTTDANNTLVNAITDENLRSTFVYGYTTSRGDIPTSGSARYDGGFFAWVVGQPNDVNANFTLSNITGTSAIDVNFATGSLTTRFASDAASPVGFSASGTSNINRDLGGFRGTIDTATIRGISANIIASSVEGNFFGPKAVEIGGALRVVGGTPDERVDIHGSFTGLRPGQ